MTSDLKRTCEFYHPGKSQCVFHHLASNFPYQWESVGRAHRALHTAARSDFYLRLRPDIVVLREFELTGIVAKMHAEGKTGWLPCTFTALRSAPFTMTAIDDMAGGTLETMNTYATWMPEMDTRTEGFVGKVMFNVSIVEPAYHAILDLLESVDFVATGV